MGLLRAAICAGACSLVACAALAGLEEPTESEQIEAPTTESKDASVATDTGSPPMNLPDGGTRPIVDAGADDAPPTCPRKEIGLVCAASLECCSDKCNEAKRCAPSCTSPFNSCNPLNEAPCCLDHYCNGLCVPCLAGGTTPTSRPIVGGPNPKSCCSRYIDGGVCG